MARAEKTFKQLAPEWLQNMPTTDREKYLIDICNTKLKDVGRLIRSPDFINICVIGPTGGGKSAFINTLLSASNYSSSPRIDAIVHGRAANGGESGHVTNMFGEYILRLRTHQNIRLIDTIGMKVEENGKWTYDGLFEHLLEGQLRHETTISLMNKQNERFLRKGVDVEEKNHAVIVVRAMNEGQSDEVFEQIVEARLNTVTCMSHMCEFTDRTRIHIPMIGVVTKIDTVSNIMDMFDNDNVVKEYTKAAKATNTSRAFPVQCYTNVDRLRNPLTDLLALDVLEEAITQAKVYKACVSDV